MEPIYKQYVVDEHNNKIAVQIDLHTFEQLEEIIEDCALAQFIRENEDETPLELNEALAYYSRFII
jgi:hypothetical protein